MRSCPRASAGMTDGVTPSTDRYLYASTAGIQNSHCDTMPRLRACVSRHTRHRSFCSERGDERLSTFNAFSLHHQRLLLSLLFFAVYVSLKYIRATVVKLVLFIITCIIASHIHHMASQRETLDPEAGVAFVRVPLPTSAQVPSEQHCPEATPDNISSPADHHGSSVADAIFNFTNSIVGAGAIGLGGAIAISGGAISIALILFFGILTKLSLDLVIRLSITTPGAHGSYEDLAQVGLGTSGRILVMACKLFYSFGCLVAYIIVVKDNFAHGLQHLLYGDEVTNNGSYLDSILQSEAWTTWVLASTVILPLCLLRDMTPLASLSVVSVFSMVAIVAIIVYMFFAHPEIRQPGGSTYEKWFEIRPGVLER